MNTLVKLKPSNLACWNHLIEIVSNNDPVTVSEIGSIC